DVVDQMDGIFFEDYIKRKTTIVNQTITHGILYGGIDWYSMSKPSCNVSVSRDSSSLLALANVLFPHIRSLFHVRSAALSGHGSLSSQRYCTAASPPCAIIVAGKYGTRLFGWSSASGQVRDGGDVAGMFWVLAFRLGPSHFSTVKGDTGYRV